MRIAARFLSHLVRHGHAAQTERLQVELQGSLALTGEGHGTPRATLLGLLGFLPETIDLDAAERALATLHVSHRLTLPGGQEIAFDPARDLILGPQATRESVLEANRSGALAKKRVLAFATHGLLPGDLPGLSQPALALSSTPGAEADPLAPVRPP